MTAGVWVLVGVLGGLGAGTRFLVDAAVRSRLATAMPWGTIVVNTTGALLIGVLAGARAVGLLGEEAYLVGATGFCGGYTTFSTAVLEAVRLAQMGDVRRAVASLLGTLVVTCALTGAAVAAFVLTG